jgi:ABC-type maltose transport system permease subunit
MALFYVFVVIFVLASVLPLVWVFKMSIVTKSELYASPPTIVPQTPNTAKYAQVFGPIDVPEGALEQHDNRLGDHRNLSLVRLSSGLRDRQVEVQLQGHGDDADTRDQLLPAVAIIAPLFMQYTQLGLINTYASVILTDVVFALPLTIWLLVAFFRELPSTLRTPRRWMERRRYRRSGW